MPQENTPSDSEVFRILIVDDEPSVREVLSGYIELEGYHATTTGSGREALKLLAQTHFDMVITDLMMPEMNGWQLLKAVKQRYPYLPVSVLTGYISEEGERMLTNSQINGYLTKPVDRARLNALITAVRETRKSDRVAKIVVLDDDTADLEAIEHALTHRGFRVATFRDPVGALKHIKENSADLLILDLILPNGDGFEICRILRESKQTSRLPILILTAAPSRANVTRAVEMGVNGFLAKPFDPHILADRALQIIKAASSPASDA